MNLMIWGKILGAGFGFMFGGPVGALFGAYVGHSFDRGASQSHFGFTNPQIAQDNFFESIFLVMGHIAKADGQVTPQEIQMAKAIMEQMRLTEDRKTKAVEYFNLGKQPEFNLDQTLSAFKQMSHGNRNLMQMFLEIQIAAAFADGSMQSSEKLILENIARVLGFNHMHLNLLINSFQAQQRFHQSGSTENKADQLNNAYQVLGISASTNDKDAKKAYRKLMSQHHPDKLVAKGLPEEMMTVAKEKSQEIQASWEIVRKERNLR